MSKKAAAIAVITTLFVIVLAIVGFMNSSKETNPILGTSEVQITNGIKHIVPLNEIIAGGPPKDGIPPIDNPKFISVEEANSFLNDNDPGIAVDINGVKKFYPYKILVWHEIVNDTIGGERILVTYCPLCFSGIVFDPLVKGERVEFGTSGKLWNSNLVMYDRKTDSLWSQILGQAIVGEMAGAKLQILPSDLVKFGDWKRINANGQVLSKNTGVARLYGTDPYGNYYTTPGTYFPVSKRDNRLDEKELVMGIEVNGKFKAYWPEAVKRAGHLTDNFEGKTIVLEYEKDIDAVRIFSAEGGSASGGEEKLERINPLTGYWFSWVASHPETELYK